MLFQIYLQDVFQTTKRTLNLIVFTFLQVLQCLRIIHHVGIILAALRLHVTTPIVPVHTFEPFLHQSLF